jgi:transposase
VLDNAAFHKAVQLEALVEMMGCKLLWLPPYSPDLNPIEISYGWMKKQIKVHNSATCS